MLIIPFTPLYLQPATARWGVLRGAEFYDVSNTDTSYWRLLHSLWNDDIMPRNIYVCEHDILPGDGVYESMLSCHYWWCTTMYPIREDGHVTSNSLGLAKFSAPLQVDYPDLFDVIGPYGPLTRNRGHWSQLDGAISETLTQRGIGPHVHGVSTHLHDYPDRQPVPAGE